MYIRNTSELCSFYMVPKSNITIDLLYKDIAVGIFIKKRI